MATPGFYAIGGYIAAVCATVIWPVKSGLYPFGNLVKISGQGRIYLQPDCFFSDLKLYIPTLAAIFNSNTLILYDVEI